MTSPLFMSPLYLFMGYRGHDYTGECDVQIVQRRRKGIPKAMRRWWKRRSAIEPVIGHVKAESRMDRNRLGGRMGDKLNAILAACGFNLRKLLRGFAHLPRCWRFCVACGGALGWFCQRRMRIRPWRRDPVCPETILAGVRGVFQHRRYKFPGIEA